MKTLIKYFSNAQWCLIRICSLNVFVVVTSSLWRDSRNELERQFLEMLQFNINVPSSVYANYYFDLRALADAHDLSFPVEPLSKERAAKLEVCSRFE